MQKTILTIISLAIIAFPCYSVNANPQARGGYAIAEPGASGEPYEGSAQPQNPGMRRRLPPPAGKGGVPPLDRRIAECCAKQPIPQIGCAPGFKEDYSTFKEVNCEGGLKAKCPKMKCVPINGKGGDCCPPIREIAPVCKQGAKPVLAPPTEITCKDGTTSLCSKGYICPEEITRRPPRVKERPQPLPYPAPPQGDMPEDTDMQGNY